MPGESRGWAFLDGRLGAGFFFAFGLGAAGSSRAGLQQSAAAAPSLREGICTLRDWKSRRLRLLDACAPATPGTAARGPGVGCPCRLLHSHCRCRRWAGHWRCRFGVYRSLATSALGKKLRLLTDRALQGHVEYLRQLDEARRPAPPPSLPDSPSRCPGAASSGALRAAAAAAATAATGGDCGEARLFPAEFWVKRDFSLPADVPSSKAGGVGVLLSAAAPDDAALFPRPGGGGLQFARGPLASLALEAFGKVQVLHGDLLAPKEGAGRLFGVSVLEEEETEGNESPSGVEDLVDCVLVPMPRSMTPYRGLGSAVSLHEDRLSFSLLLLGGPPRRRDSRSRGFALLYSALSFTGLRVLERGGEGLQRVLMKTLKKALQTKVHEAETRCASEKPPPPPGTRNGLRVGRLVSLPHCSHGLYSQGPFLDSLPSCCDLSLSCLCLQWRVTQRAATFRRQVRSSKSGLGYCTTSRRRLKSRAQEAEEFELCCCLCLSCVVVVYV